MRIKAAKWWCNQGPPILIFREAQAAMRLLAPLFSIDSFLQNSPSFDRGFCRKLLHKSSRFCKKRCFLFESGKSCEFFYISVGKWYSARAPPRKSGTDLIHFQIFGGIAMNRHSKRKNITKTFFECSLGEHTKVYYHPQRATEGGGTHDPN